MRNTIKKILKEDFDWVSSQHDLPLDDIKELSDQHEKILNLKIKLREYLDGKEGMENFDYSTRPNHEEHKGHYIVEQVREIYNEVNNIEGSLRDLPSSLEHLEYLVTGIDTENDEY